MSRLVAHQAEVSRQARMLAAVTGWPVTTILCSQGTVLKARGAGPDGRAGFVMIPVPFTPPASEERAPS